MTTKSDKELVRQFLAGDQNAFTEFIQRHQDRIYRLACARLYQQEDAVDAAQEAFLRAYRGFGRFRFKAEPFTWLYKTLDNVCNEFNRRTVRDRKMGQKIAEQNTITDNAPDGAEHIHMQQIRQLTLQLPKRQCEVVLLRIFEGMSIEETAKTLDSKPGTIKANLNKAIKNLRNLAIKTEILDEISHEIADDE